MRKFGVQFLKEFKSYFGNYNAYVIFAVYYILSMFSTFYLGDYFLRESDIMNSFFSLQPMILSLVLPAVTMKSWADEAKSGTLELLMTQPIGYFTLVLAKTGAAFAFFLLMISASLPLLFTSGQLFIMDYGVVLSGYWALIACGATFCAIGCMISAYNKSNILSYIVTIFVLFVIVLSEFTEISFSKIVIPLESLNFNYNYNAYLSGNFSIGSILYFPLGTIIALWINTIVLSLKKSQCKKTKQTFRLFLGLLLIWFVNSVLAINFNFPKAFDFTDNKIYTLAPEHVRYLEKTDKKITITLYESADKRSETNSQYASLTEFAEKTLKLIEFASQGTISTEFIRVPSFSHLEGKLILDDKIGYETDALGKKIFLAAKFSDNDGHETFIKTFSGLRQDCFETDFMRIIKLFGQPKKDIVIIADKDELNKITAFTSMLEEFYNVEYWNNSILFIPEKYKAVIAINPNKFSSDFLLAFEQYILDGGSFILFSDPAYLNKYQNTHLSEILKNFGLSPIMDEVLKFNFNNEKVTYGTAENKKHFTDIHDVLINTVGEIKAIPSDRHVISPLLEFSGKTIGAYSSGNFVSNYLDEAAKSEHIEATSTKKGNIFFIYDSDLLNNDIYVSKISKGTSFYEAITVGDNQKFLLKLIDLAVNGNIENDLIYKHYNKNPESIGIALQNNVKKKFDEKRKVLEKKLTDLQNDKDAFYFALREHGYVSAKNIGDISKVEQNIEKIKMELDQMQSIIFSEYQTSVILFTLYIIFVIPLFALIILFTFTHLFKLAKLKKIRSLSHVE